jgi:hypothetical protein
MGLMKLLVEFVLNRLATMGTVGRPEHLQATCNTLLCIIQDAGEFCESNNAKAQNLRSPESNTIPLRHQGN